MGRRVRGKTNPLTVRRVVQVALTPEQATVLTEICRGYGLVDENGAPRGVEAIRCLIVIGLTRGAHPARRAAVAARVNSKMMVASMGVRLSSALGASTASGPRPTWVPRRVNLHFDASLASQMQKLAPVYRDHRGIVLDARMAMDLAKLGLADPDLVVVLGHYAPCINRMRARLLACEAEVRSVVDEAASDLASLVDPSAARARLEQEAV